MASNVGVSRTKTNEDEVKRARARRRAEETAAGMAGAGLSGGTGATSMSTGSQTDYGTGTPGISNTSGWWGGLNQQGGQASADDPLAFWANYGGPSNKGWDPYGNTQSFFEATFNPEGLANMAFPGSGQKSYESQLAGATNVANTLTGGDTFKNVDPKALIGNVMQALASGDMQNLAKLNPAFAEILSAGQMSAGGTIQALMSFLKESLAGAIPPEAMGQLMTMLQNAGREYFQSSSQANSNASPSQAIQFIMQRLGPTLGF